METYKMFAPIILSLPWGNIHTCLSGTI